VGALEKGWAAYPPKRHDQCVYIIEKDGLVKIGYSMDVERRIASFAPDKVHAVFRGTRDEEKHLHGLLRAYRERSEWYRNEFLVRTLLEEAKGGGSAMELCLRLEARRSELELIHWKAARRRRKHATREKTAKLA
jgi:predicted GIY-YIG superfamily endonuclease